MSARERAHPWWVDPLPPYRDKFGGDPITLRLPIICINCHMVFAGHHFAFRCGDYLSPFFCRGSAKEWEPCV